MSQSYFNFNRKEKLGVVALSGLVLGLIVVLNVGYSTYIPDPLDIDESKLEFISLANPTVVEGESNTENHSSQNMVNSPFDPNEIGQEDWVEMGFSEKQATSIMNYRQNYGPFKQKEDLQKLYVISDEMYAEMEPYIQIKRVEKQQNKPSFTNDANESPEEFHPLDLNMATKADLMALNGIGPAYADRIIAFREKIGGFVDPEQIGQIYMSDEAKTLLTEKAVIHTSNLRKLNPNTASKDEIRAIPYSNWAVVTAIIKYRETHAITNLDFLTDEINPENKAKFELYLEF